MLHYRDVGRKKIERTSVVKEISKQFLTYVIEAHCLVLQNTVLLEEQKQPLEVFSKKIFS